MDIKSLGNNWTNIPHRFKCDNCKKLKSESLYFVGTKKNFTYRYAKNITKQVIHSDLKNVAKNNKLTPEEVETMVMSIALNINPINFDSWQRLGIDEISRGGFLAKIYE